MVDKAAIIREAQKFIAKGQIDKAIAEWEKLLKEAPDGATYNTVGDLHLKNNNKQGAIEAYHKASRILRDEGFSLKALAFYKKILNINPSDGDALFALGELNEEKNIVTDAIKYYLAAADVFSKQNSRDKLHKTYDKILALAPTNIPLRLKISEMFSKEGFIAEAAKEYIDIGNMYGEQGDLEGRRKFISKALEIQPSNTDAMLAMADMAKGRGDFDEAIKYLTAVLNVSGEDVDILLKLAEMLIHKESIEEAREYINRAKAKDPDNSTAKRLLGDYFIKSGDMNAAWQEYNVVLDEMIFKEKYPDAIDILNMFKDIDPIESRRKLVSLYKQTEDMPSAVLELASLCEIYDGSGLKNDAIKCCSEALSIDPENIEVKAKIRQLEDEMGIEEEAPAEKTTDEMLTESDIFLRYGLYDEARTMLEGLKAKDPQNIEVHKKLKALYLDTGDKEQAITECLIMAEIYRKAGSEEQQRGALREAYDINPEDPRLAESSMDETPSPETQIRQDFLEEEPVGESREGLLNAGERSIEDFAEELSEADFYVKQGLPAEAARIYRKLFEDFPENEELRNKLQAVEGHSSNIEETIPEEHLQSFSIDDLSEDEPLAEKPIEEEVKEPELQNDVLEIFEEFKKGLAKDLEAEDYETHYNLGIAYKEMGLVDDAINEFQIAKKDPKFFIQAVSTLGMAYMQKELYALAIDSLSSAIMKIDPKEESYWSLKYDLADAYDKNGDQKQAYQLYTEVYGWNSKFREVATKILTLRGGSRPQPAPQQPQQQYYQPEQDVQIIEETASPSQQGQPQKPVPPPVDDTPPKKKSRVSYI